MEKYIKTLCKDGQGNIIMFDKLTAKNIRNLEKRDILIDGVSLELINTFNVEQADRYFKGFYKDLFE